MSMDPVNTLTQQESSLIAEVHLGLGRTLGSAWRCRKQSWLLEEVAKVSQRDSAPINMTGTQDRLHPRGRLLDSHDQQSSEKGQSSRAPGNTRDSPRTHVLSVEETLKPPIAVDSAVRPCWKERSLA